MPGNHYEVLLPSAARTATPTAITRSNQDYRGILFTVHVTAIGAAPAITLFLRTPNAAGVYTAHTIWQASAAISTVSAQEYLLYPGASGGNVTEVDAIPLPTLFDIVMSHGNADSITYDLVAHYLA